MILHRTQQSTLFDIINDRLASLPCRAGLLTQHALRALNVPVSSADHEADRALNS